MTDNIFEKETTALANFACVARDSCILLADFACAYPGVNHSWIFHVLEKTELSVFFQQFLRMIHSNSMTELDILTELDFSGEAGGQIFMAMGVRQGCPASGFFEKKIKSYFRWLHHAVIPRDPAVPASLQPAPCAYVDDFAVAVSSFRSLMPALSPAFKVIDSIAGRNFHHQKCLEVQFGNDRCQGLLDELSTLWAKYVGLRQRKIHSKCVW